MPKPSFISAIKYIVENKLQNLNMRILNIVLSAEIKYQRYAKLRKFRHKNFRSNFDPGKTHKGKTSERAFYYLWAFEKNLLQHIHLTKFTQTYLDIPVALLLDF
jgi:hypothetical protein